MARKKDEFEELLGTPDKKEQIARIEGLQRALNMPVIDVIIRFDPIPDQVGVTVIGGNLGFDVANHILDLVRKDLQRQEIIASIDQQVKQNDGQPEHPDLPPEDSAEPSPELSAPEVAAE